MEIPFVDGREGACGTTITKQKRIILTETWEKQRPHMLMIHADQWSEIRKSWKKACRLAVANGQECNAQLDSVDSAIRGLDDLIKAIGGMKP